MAAPWPDFDRTVVQTAFGDRDVDQSPCNCLPVVEADVAVGALPDRSLDARIAGQRLAVVFGAQSLGDDGVRERVTQHVGVREGSRQLREDPKPRGPLPE